MIRIAALTATAALALGGAAASTTVAGAAEAPGHIVLAGGKLAVYTSGRTGSPVTLGRYRASNKGEAWDMDNFANPYGAGSFYWAPGGKQTSDYLVVTAAGARLHSGAPGSTIFAPVASGKYTVLATLGKNGPSRTVLTDRGGRLVLAAEGRHGPSSDQKWSIR